jgi:Mg-chelatase subunit ChlD
MSKPRTTWTRHSRACGNPCKPVRHSRACGNPAPRTPFCFCIVLLAGLLLLSCPLTAQTQLNFKRIINNWPTIELYYTTSCNGERSFILDKSKFRIEENGVEIKDFELWCPDPVERCPASLSLVIDAGAGMAGTADSAAREGARWFIQKMVNNGDHLDEASVTFSGDSIVLRQGMTTDYDTLRTSLDTLPSAGRSRILDGIYCGIDALITNGVNQCRAVIVFTNGLDTVSTHTLQEIIRHANRNRIRVFMLGVGDSIASGWQQSLANLTGGRYYERPKAWQLLAIYQEITTIMFGGPIYECLITYMTHGMNGSLRTVNLTVRDSCGTDTKSKTYKALHDTSTYIPLKFRLSAGRETYGNSLVAVPLRLDDTFYADTFQPVTFTVLYDEQCARFAGISVPQGSPWDGVPIALAHVPGGIEVKTMKGKVLASDQSPATLAELVFQTSDPDGRDTV